MSYTKEQYKEWLASKPPEYLEGLRERKIRRSARWYRENRERSRELDNEAQRRYYVRHKEEVNAKASLRWARRKQPWARLPVFYVSQP